MFEEGYFLQNETRKTEQNVALARSNRNGLSLCESEEPFQETVVYSHKSSVPQFLPGESVIQKLEMAIDQGGPGRPGNVYGILCFAHYRMQFEPMAVSCEVTDERESVFTTLSIPFGLVARLEVVPAPQQNISASAISFASFSGRASDSPLQVLEMWSKVCGPPLRFTLPQSTQVSFFETLNNLVFPPSIDRLFAFKNREIYPRHAQKVTFAMRKDMERMKVDLHSGKVWRVSDVNSDYGMCNTYPAQLIVPASITDAQLKASAAFRSRGRLPVLTYQHSSGATISRCSQPLCGVARARSAEDEALVGEIRALNPERRTLTVFDCRSKTSAIANFATGGGTERESHYKDTRIVYLSIENMHSVAYSYAQLLELCSCENESRWLSRLEGTRWLDLVQHLLQCASLVATKLHHDKESVLIHCSDGWDRTPQLSSLAQLLLEPYYRTIGGFALLIEKEWLAFGHRFASRCGHCNPNTLDDQRSPVFLQWLDCVWQLTRQFPTSFEFNSWLLASLALHHYSNRFVTFLFDSEQERSWWRDKVAMSGISSTPPPPSHPPPSPALSSSPVPVSVSTSTSTSAAPGPCFFSYVQERSSSFRNRFYEGSASASASVATVLWPRTSPEHFALWPIHLRHTPLAVSAKGTSELECEDARETMMESLQKEITRLEYELKDRDALLRRQKQLGTEIGGEARLDIDSGNLSVIVKDNYYDVQ